MDLNPKLPETMGSSRKVFTKEKPLNEDVTGDKEYWHKLKFLDLLMIKCNEYLDQGLELHSKLENSHMENRKLQEDIREMRKKVQQIFSKIYNTCLENKTNFFTEASEVSDKKEAVKNHKEIFMRFQLLHHKVKSK